MVLSSLSSRAANKYHTSPAISRNSDPRREGEKKRRGREREMG